VIRRRAVVHGRVQGVFYRDSARRQADSLGVSGWIANCDDGSVEAVFEGDPEAVETMLAFCGEGPSGAAVERIDVSEEQPEGLRGFTVR
jgi:acylphosphatase